MNWDFLKDAEIKFQLIYLKKAWINKIQSEV